MYYVFVALHFLSLSSQNHKCNHTDDISNICCYAIFGALWWIKVVAVIYIRKLILNKDYYNHYNKSPEQRHFMLHGKPEHLSISSGHCINVEYLIKCPWLKWCRYTLLLEEKVINYKKIISYSLNKRDLNLFKISHELQDGCKCCVDAC